MEAVREKVTNQQFYNKCAIDIGLMVISEGIKDFVKDTIKDLHLQLQAKLTNMQTCNKNCSKKPMRWCNTCICWKKEILNYHRYTGKQSQIQWKNIDSSKWPTSEDEIIKIFLPSWWNGGCDVTNDISATLTLIDNCMEFKVKAKSVKNLKRIRDEYAHKNKLDVTDIKKNQSFDRMGEFLNDSELKITDSSRNDALKQICYLKTNSLDQVLKKSLLGAKFNQLLQSNTELLNLVKSEINRLDQHISPQIENIKFHRTHGSIYWTDEVKIAVIFFFSLWILIPPEGNLDEEIEDCKSIAFNHEWKNDIDFQGYLKEHTQLIGRKWLIDNITKSLHRSNRGILFTADWGFGKSALISHFLCSHDKSVESIKTNVLSYHICRYDVDPTLKTTFFIRILAGMIVKNIPDFVNEILKNDLAREYLYENKYKCEQEPKLCIDFALIHPLARYDKKRENVFILIDALDECVSKLKDRNIAELLYSRIHKFPRWIKFFITSRDVDGVRFGLPSLTHIHIDSNDERAIKDITEYLDYIGTTLPKPSSKHIKDSNFLVVKLSLDHWLESDNPSKAYISEPLMQSYSLNLKRVFGSNGEKFEDVKFIFELLSTAHRPLTRADINEIADFHKFANLTEIKSRNDLKHFVYFGETHISLIHKSLSDFLTNIQRSSSPFYISIENGHRLLSKFYLHRKNNITSSNAIKLAHHVVESNEKSLRTEFKKLFQKYQDEIITTSEESILHRASREYDSYEIITLLMETFTNLRIDNVNFANVTSAFLASAYGHTDTLNALIENGASVNFKIKSFDNILLNFSEVVSFCKYTSLWGYNMLHIAAQNGHTTTARVLISVNKTLLYRTNELELNAFQLASEHGHVDIMEMFLDTDSSLVDQYSLHSAAKNGHYKAVVLLVKYGAFDTCLRCDGSFYWMNNDVRAQGRLNSPASDKHDKKSQYLIKRKLFDDWWRIQCETALEAAVKGGFLEIVRLLLDQTPNALNCREYGGRTPILTAAQLDREDLFQLLESKGGNVSDRCSFQQDIPTEKENYLSSSEYYHYIHERCPSNFTIAHIIATNSNENLAQYFMRITYSGWQTTDEEGATPMHYAACNSNLKILKFLNENIFINHFPLTKNGSTPFHSAAICGSFISIKFLAETHYGLLNVTDVEGRSFYQYAIIGRKGRNLTNNEIINTFSIITYKWKENRNIFQVDKQGENILHYIAEYGLADVMSDIVNEIGREAIHLLDERNIYGETPLDVAFKFLSFETTNSLLFKRADCNIWSTFTSSCSINVKAILTTHEYIIVILLKYLNQYNLITNFNLSEQIFKATNSFYVILAIKEFAPTQFHSEVQTGSIITAFLKHGVVPHIASILFPVHHINCGANLTHNPLYRIVMNKNNKYWMYSPYHDNEFIHRALLNWSGKSLDNCFDKDGYNLLHRAALGGHMAAIKYLHEVKGMQLHRKTRSHEDVLSLVIYNAPYLRDRDICKLKNIRYLTYTERGEIVNETVMNNDRNQTNNYDIAAKYLIGHIEKINISKTVVCPSKRKMLGLVHIAAAKGLLNFLKGVSKLYGKEFLSCENAHAITPKYIAMFLNQTSVLKYLVSVQLIPPMKYAQVFLFKKYVNNFRKFFSAKSRKCLFERSFATTRRMIYKRFSCTLFFLNDLFFKNILFSTMYFEVEKREAIESILKLKNALQNYLRIGLDTDLNNWCREFNFNVFLLWSELQPFQMRRYVLFCSKWLSTIGRWKTEKNPFYRNFMRLILKLGDDLMWQMFNVYHLYPLAIGIVPENYFKIQDDETRRDIVRQLQIITGNLKEYKVSRSNVNLYLSDEFRYLDNLKTEEMFFRNQSMNLIKEIYNAFYNNSSVSTDINELPFIKFLGPADFPLKSRWNNATIHDIH